MKKKVYIGLLSIVAVVFLALLLITYTDLTKECAVSVAKNQLSSNYPKWGSIVESDISSAMTKRLTFPKFTKRSYIAVFMNDAEEIIRMEISAYPPFKIIKEDIIP